MKEKNVSQEPYLGNRERGKNGRQGGRYISQKEKMIAGGLPSPRMVAGRLHHIDRDWVDDTLVGYGFYR